VPPAQPARTTATVAVGQPTEATLLAGNAITTISFPQASSGTGTLLLSGSATLPSQATTGTGSVNVVTLPGSPIAAVTIAPSATATYATLPTLTFTLPGNTPIANESFVLDLDDPATGLGLLTVGEYIPTSTANGVLLTPSTGLIAIPYPVEAPPIVPITYSASNSVGFVLYEVPSSS
jgi:hypothetical protein